MSKKAHKKRRPSLKGALKHFRLTSRLAIQAAIIALVLCCGVSALVIQHNHNKPAPAVATSAADDSNNCLLNSSGCPDSQSASTPAPASTTQSTPSTTKNSTPSVSIPTVTVCDYDYAAKSTLAQGYDGAAQTIDSEIDSTVDQANKHNITQSQAIDELNGIIAGANKLYANDYQGYVSQRQQGGCSVTVSPPPTLSSCTYDGGYDDVANCIATVTMPPSPLAGS